nr:DUF305 domain-containing protein [uncultured Devosia sp.]
MKASLFAVTVILTTSIPTFAQDAHAGHGAPPAAGSSASEAGLVAQLPEICLTASAPPAAPMEMGHEMNAAQADLMAGMDENNALMMSAGMVDDIDVAFVCSMIPHHQSAINMAKAELDHGDNPWAKEMAQKIIDAQEAEIAEMVAWLQREGVDE